MGIHISQPALMLVIISNGSSPNVFAFPTLHTLCQCVIFVSCRLQSSMLLQKFPHGLLSGMLVYKGEFAALLTRDWKWNTSQFISLFFHPCWWNVSAITLLPPSEKQIYCYYAHIHISWLCRPTPRLLLHICYWLDYSCLICWLKIVKGGQACLFVDHEDIVSVFTLAIQLKDLHSDLLS